MATDNYERISSNCAWKSELMNYQQTKVILQVSILQKSHRVHVNNIHVYSMRRQQSWNVRNINQWRRDRRAAHFLRVEATPMTLWHWNRSATVLRSEVWTQWGWMVIGRLRRTSRRTWRRTSRRTSRMDLECYPFVYCGGDFSDTWKTTFKTTNNSLITNTAKVRSSAPWRLHQENSKREFPVTLTSKNKCSLYSFHYPDHSDAKLRSHWPFFWCASRYCFRIPQWQIWQLPILFNPF